MIPETRVQYLEQNKYNETRGIGPCGGFSTQYACMCDYHTLPYREEVAWVIVSFLYVYFTYIEKKTKVTELNYN